MMPEINSILDSIFFRFADFALVAAVVISIIFGIVSAFAVYKRERYIVSNEGHIPLPAKLLNFAIILSLVSIIWGVWNSHYSYNTLLRHVNKMTETQTAIDEVMNLDSILTYSAEMAVRTGDLKWEQQYNKNVTILDDTIFKIKTKHKDLDLSYVNATEEANNVLVAIEKKAFKLVNEGNLDKAHEELDSQKYLENKKIYADGMHEFLQQLDKTINKNFFVLTRSLHYLIYPATIALALLIVTWFFAMRSVRQWQRELEEKRIKAEEANLAKSEFLSNMSHELRTPMNSIIGMAEILKSSNLNSEQSENLQILHDSGEDLLNILNDILDISKIEAGEFKMESIAFCLDSAISQVIQPYLPIAKKQGVDLRVENIKNVPNVLMGDLGRIQQILRNLISNSIKFTKEGSVTINAKSIIGKDNQNKLYISITDTGIGISKEKIGCIFDKFTQADSSITRKFGGTGLGLAITKKLLELMDGEIGVESEEGKGTSFWFTIPLVKAPKNAQPINLVTENKIEKITNIPSELHVLSVDDHPVNQLFIKKLLKNLGVSHVEQAENGKQALDMISKNEYDVVLMDCQMPELDGYQATTMLREIEKETEAGTYLPVIALTANAMAGDKEKCLEAGMDDYLSKPVRSYELVSALKNVIPMKKPN